jgi:hypothetical protein
MKSADVLSLLANIEIMPIERLPEEFLSWAEKLSEKELRSFVRNFSDDITLFAESIALPLERVGDSEDPLAKRQNEALAYYAIAMWKVYQIDFSKEGYAASAGTLRGEENGIAPPPKPFVDELLCSSIQAG